MNSVDVRYARQAIALHESTHSVETTRPPGGAPPSPKV